MRGWGVPPYPSVDCTRPPVISEYKTSCAASCCLQLSIDCPSERYAKKMPNCSVFFCKKRSETSSFRKDNVTFHLFPKDPRRRQIWTQACGNHETWVAKRTSTVCSEHFEEPFFINQSNNKRKLNGSAVPTLKLLEMPLTPAEKQRKYREKLKSEKPDKYEEVKKRSAENAARHYRKKTSQYTENEKEELRQKWRDVKKKRKLAVEDNTRADLDNPKNIQKKRKIIENSLRKKHQEFKEDIADAELNSEDDISDEDAASMFEEKPTARRGSSAKPHTATSSSLSRAKTNVSSGGVHEGFQCNVCGEDINGFRYTCVQCSDYDMCSACEARRAHAHHYVLRVPGPRPYLEVRAVVERIRKELLGVVPSHQVEEMDEELDEGLDEGLDEEPNEEDPGTGDDGDEESIKVEVKQENLEPDPLQDSSSHVSGDTEPSTSGFPQPRPWTILDEAMGNIKVEVDSTDETTTMAMPQKRHTPTTHKEPPKKMHIEINSGFIVKTEPIEEQGSVVLGQGSVVPGLGSVVSGQGSVVSGQGSVVSGQGSVVPGNASDTQKQKKDSGQFSCEVFSHNTAGGSRATNVAGTSKGSVTKTALKKEPVPGKKVISAKRKNKRPVAKISSSSDDSDVEETAEKAEPVMDNLPLKSQYKYMKSYEKFMQWRNEKNEESFSENVFLAHFNELAQTLKPSSLWSYYSMLKATINSKHNICIKDYATLTALLRKQAHGYKSKKSKVLTAENVDKFLKEAPDQRYLVMKVALIFGVNGGCKSLELTNMTTNNIENRKQIMLVNLPANNTDVDRTFVVRDEMLSVVKKYQALRPKNVGHDRFFLNYQNGKCTSQPIGKNKMATMPKEIATYLNLPNAESYTGHCFRRTSGLLLAGRSVAKIPSSSDDSDVEEVVERAEPVMDNLPLKSQYKYMKSYEKFLQWKNDKNEESFSENVFLAHFNELAQTLKPSSLWSHYSMLKATMNVKHNICLKDYATLTALLRKQAHGYKSKKSKVLTAENVDKFLKEAPDQHYLAIKVALIFGVSGGCRSLELTNITINNIENHNEMMLINLPTARNTDVDRTFVVRDEMFSVVKKYQALRPENVGHDRFFLNYQDGKCTTQAVGKNKMGSMPKEIATYLNLPNAESYTGHCFRRTSAFLLTGLRRSVAKIPSSSDDSDVEEIVERAEPIIDNLPSKSQSKYWKTYEKFMQWRNEKNEESFSENVFLAYFNELAQTLKPSSLWSHYSILKTTMKSKHNIFIKDYTKLTALLKKQTHGYKSQKSKVLTAENIDKFLSEAPDQRYLAMKVALIFGVKGGCKSIELTQMTTNNIESHNQMMLVNLPTSNNDIDRTFVVRDEMLSLVKKYQALRPKNVGHDRFFLNYHNGKCTTQPVGSNKMVSMPKEIATYLNLPDAESYTGHCFRRTSASLLAGVKRHGWKSDQASLEVSMENKSRISKQMTELKNVRASTSTEAKSSPHTFDVEIEAIKLETPSTRP